MNVPLSDVAGESLIAQLPSISRVSLVAFGFSQKQRRGSSFVDLVALLIIVGIGFALVIVAVQQQREAARKTSCQNNIRNIGIALIHYHQDHMQFPVHGTGTHDETSATADPGDAGPDGSGGSGGGNNGKSLSFLVGILPNLDQQDLWETISQPLSRTVAGQLANGSHWNPMGPSTRQRAYPPWVTDLSILRCPTDPRKSNTTGRTNYAACLGDAIDFQMDSAVRFHETSMSWQLDPRARERINAAARGAFIFREATKLSDITDGLSNTLLVGEILTSQGDRDSRTSPALGIGTQTSEVPVRGGIFDRPMEGYQFLDPQRPQFWNRVGSRLAPKLPLGDDEYRGMRWADARTVFTGFNTILPPNGCLQVAGDDVDGPAAATVSSGHPGGAHVLLADGSTKFIVDSIDCGNLWGGTVRLGMTGPLSPGSPSPFNAWGALGTRSANDH